MKTSREHIMQKVSMLPCQCMCAATVALPATSIHCECRRASMGFQIYRTRVLCQVSFGPVGDPTRVAHIAISYLPWSPQALDFRGMWKV